VFTVIDSVLTKGHEVDEFGADEFSDSRDPYFAPSRVWHGRSATLFRAAASPPWRKHVHDHAIGPVFAEEAVRRAVCISAMALLAVNGGLRFLGDRASLRHTHASSQGPRQRAASDDHIRTTDSRKDDAMSQLIRKPHFSREGTQ
jgi:hypothetical protein